jgi:hypothetical protein
MYKRITMADTLVGHVEWGKFDLGRLPINWNNVDIQKQQKLVRELERSTDRQRIQLEAKIDDGKNNK